MIIIGEVNIEFAVGHSGWVDQQTIEYVQIGGISLSTIDSGLGSSWESGLNEVLHFGWVGESECRCSL